MDAWKFLDLEIEEQANYASARIVRGDTMPKDFETIPEGARCLWTDIADLAYLSLHSPKKLVFLSRMTLLVLQLRTGQVQLLPV